METVNLGKTDLKVSSLCLGTMFFGTTVDEATAFRLLDQYVEAGGTFLDTANCYAFWADNGTGDESEALLGRWFTARGNRDALTVATKVGCRPRYLGAPFPEEAQGLRREVIFKDVEESLRRLGVETIDLYYTHQDDRSTPLEETLGALDALVQSGKVRQLGCSNMAAWRIEQARNVSETNGNANFCCAQLRHTYLPGGDTGVQLHIGEEHLDYALNQGLSLLAYSPLLGGVYTRADRPVPREYVRPGYETYLATLNEVAAEVGATPNQVVLAWMRQSRPAIIPLIAASTAEQLQENLEAVQVTLSPEHLARLAEPTVTGQSVRG